MSTLNATSALAAGLAAAAVAVALPPPDVGVRRARRVVRPARDGSPGPVAIADRPRGARNPVPDGALDGVRNQGRDGARDRTRLLHLLATLGAFGLCVTVVGGGLGLVLGVAAAVAARSALRRIESTADRAARDRIDAELAEVADLVADCLDCGATPTHAVETVAAALGRPWADLLLPPLSALRLGADPRRCWQQLAAVPESAPLADVLARGVDDGVALVPLLRALAADRRRERRGVARQRAQRVGVLALGPLAACFLPAFVLVGVVPVVVSVGRDVLGGLL